MVTDEGRSYFVFASGCDEGIDVRVSSMSRIDIDLHIMDYGMDFDSEIEKLRDHELEAYGILWGDEIPDELRSSLFYDAVKVCCLAIQNYSIGDDALAADKFIAPYTGIELSEIQIPEPDMDDLDEEQ